MHRLIELRQDRMLVLGRRIRICMVAMTFLLCAIVSQRALAQVTTMSFTKAKVHQQTVSNTPPGAPVSWSAGISIGTTSPTDYSGVSLSIGTFNFVFVGATWEFSNTYSDQASLDADFPQNGSFSLTFSAGTLPGFSANTFYASDSYPSFPPYLVGTSFDGLQGMDPSIATTVSFLNSSAANSQFAFVKIVEDPNGVDLEVLSTQILFTDTSFTIPVDFLTQNTIYRIEIGYGTGSTLPALFTELGISYFQGFESSTFVEFTTGAAPPRNSDLNRDGIVDGADLGLLLGAWGTSP